LGNEIKEITINPATDLIFDNKVREACKSCKRYTKKATCPPYVETVEYYKSILPKYKYGKIFYKRFEVPKDYTEPTDEESKPNTLGRKSSLEIHNHLLKERMKLNKEGHYFVVILGSGSCKLCTTCDFPCAFPAQSVIPMEGTGMDVFAMMKKQGINDINFPINSYFYRVGCILYD